MTSWAQEGFRTIDIGDRWLDRRVVLLAERPASDPCSSIPHVFGGWVKTQAAYRFLSQDKFNGATFRSRTGRRPNTRMRAHRVVLCLQDTTELDFNGQEAQGLSSLSYEAQRGMYLHPTYAVTPAREPLGMLDACMRARQVKDAKEVRVGELATKLWSLAGREIIFHVT